MQKKKGIDDIFFAFNSNCAEDDEQIAYDLRIDEKVYAKLGLKFNGRFFNGNSGNIVFEKEVSCNLFVDFFNKFFESKEVELDEVKWRK